MLFRSPRLAHEAGLRALQKLTPSRTGTGRAGLRYPTEVYLQLRADHAFARDAVISEPSAGFVQSLGAIELRSQAADLQTFLLQPDRGRRLDDESKRKLLAEGTRGMTEASMHHTPSMPWMRPSPSVTAMGSSAAPMRRLATTWWKVSVVRST